MTGIELSDLILLSLKITPYFCFIALILLIGVHLINIQKSKRHLLSNQIKIKIKEMRSGKTPYYILDKYTHLYTPSVNSFCITFVVFILISIPSKINWKCLSLPTLKFNESSHFQNIISIHAGVGAIIFALIIFVAESLKDDETKDRARVLLKESFLFPLTVMGILVFTLFLWGNVNCLVLLPVLVVATLTIVSLGKLFIALLSRAKFEKERILLLKDRIKQSIYLALQERVGTNCLMGHFGEGKIELRFRLFSIDDTDTYECFYAKCSGVIIDIRMDKLREFAIVVETESNRNGFSFCKDKVKKSELVATVGSVFLEENPHATYKHNDKRFLNVKFKDDVVENETVLLAVDKTTIRGTDGAVMNKLTRLADCF